MSDGFAIDGGGLFVEKSSLCAGRMASRSFSKTVGHNWESRGSSDGMVSPCTDSVYVSCLASCITSNTFVQLACFGLLGRDSRNPGIKRKTFDCLETHYDHSLNLASPSLPCSYYSSVEPNH